VADSKLCTDEQLAYITAHGGRAITIVPDTWKETRFFKEKLMQTKIAKAEIWRRTKPGTEDEIEYFSAFKGEYFSEKRGYRLHWIYSSEKRDRDRNSRNDRLQKAEKELSELVGNLNTKKYKTKDAILFQSEKILSKYNVGKIIKFNIGTTKSKEIKQIGKGRPSEKTKFREIIEESERTRNAGGLTAVSSPKGCHR
jgi:transposase